MWLFDLSEKQDNDAKGCALRHLTGTLQPSIKVAGAFQATKSSLQALHGMPQAFERRKNPLAKSICMEYYQT